MIAPPGLSDRNGGSAMRVISRPETALNSSTAPSGRAPSTALTPRFVISQTPPRSAAIAKGTFVTDAMTRISAPVTALISVTDPLSTSMTQTPRPAAAIASGPFS